MSSNAQNKESTEHWSSLWTDCRGNIHDLVCLQLPTLRNFDQLYFSELLVTENSEDMRFFLTPPDPDEIGALTSTNGMTLFWIKIRRDSSCIGALVSQSLHLCVPKVVRSNPSYREYSGVRIYEKLSCFLIALEDVLNSVKATLTVVWILRIKRDTAWCDLHALISSVFKISSVVAVDDVEMPLLRVWDCCFVGKSTEYWVVAAKIVIEVFTWKCSCPINPVYNEKPSSIPYDEFLNRVIESYKAKILSTWRPSPKYFCQSSSYFQLFPFQFFYRNENSFLILMSTGGK